MLFFYVLGTSIVKGFALTLAIGVLVSMFSAITVTKNFMHLIFGTGELKHPALFGLNNQIFKMLLLQLKPRKKKQNSVYLIKILTGKSTEWLHIEYLMKIFKRRYIKKWQTLI